MRDRKLSETAEEMNKVWKWYKQYAYIEKSDDDWTKISIEATKIADSLRTELGKLLVNAALNALYREGRE